MTTRSSQYKLLYVAAGLIPKSTNGIRPNTYPYTTPKQNSIDLQGKKDGFHPDETSSKPEKAYDNESPMDLSQKESKNELNFLSQNSEFLPKSKAESPSKSGPTTTNSVPPYLLASINNSTTQQQHDKLAADLSKSHMLQAYLTAKALHDVKIKQLQSAHRNVRTFIGNRDVESEKQFDMVSQLHQNFCRIYEKTVENDCVNLKRFRGENEGSGTTFSVAECDEPNQLGSVDGSKVEKISDNGRKFSVGDVNSNKLVDARKLEEDKTKGGNLKAELKDKCDSSDRISEKSENVSVTLETSGGKMILVSIPTETDKGSSSPPTFLSKSGDTKLKAEFFPPSSGPSPSYVR